MFSATKIEFFGIILKKCLLFSKVLYICSPKLEGIIDITMYAIVEIAGQQFKVAKDDKIYVNRLQNNEGESVDFENVLLVADKSVKVGTPTVKGAKVTVKVLAHVKGDKVIVFKKRRRKGYRVKNGFRAALTQVQVENIVA